ncbi:MAG TPA: DNA primase [Candidatus Dormibacteraeota bacterium]|nr:DNA primase [Candidatus Dormibacteraeota bacterium]
MTTLSDFKETVRQQADIVRVIGDYIKLKKAGAQNFVGLCPFHGEKTPSFSVHATRQFFHCFGCGKSGDVFAFVQEREQISFPEAVRLIAEKVGVPLPKMQYSSESEAEDAGRRGRLIEMHERACKFFEDQLRKPEGAHAREYLAGRGLKEETIRTFRIGFAPDSGFTLKDRLKADFSEEMMRASGLFSWKEGADGATTPERARPARSGDPGSGGPATSAMYSKFRNRIMFPIANENGKIIAFTGRTLATDDKSGPKYMNSPETPIYSKGRVLYNLDRAKEAIRKLGYVIIVEGQMDCIAVYSAGFHNVAASSGTAFTETQVRLLGRFSKDIVVNFDPDTAGAAATDKSLGMLLEEEFNIRVLRLEAGFDPDLFIRKNGAEAYAKALKGSLKYFDYLVERALRLFPVRSPEGKKNAVNFLLPHIHRVPSRIVRDELANDIAQKLNIDTTVLRQEFKSAAVSRAAGGLRNQPDEDVTPAEKVLVRAASSMIGEEAELRHMAVDALAEERLHTGLTTETLLEAILQNALAVERGDGVDDVMALPLSDANRQRLAKIVMREDEPLTADLLAGALNALRHQRQLSQREGEIKRGIVEAERRNDVAALLRLKQEKLELDRKLASGG